MQDEVRRDPVQPRQRVDRVGPVRGAARERAREGLRRDLAGLVVPDAALREAEDGREMPVEELGEPRGSSSEAAISSASVMRTVFPVGAGSSIGPDRARRPVACAAVASEVLDLFLELASIPSPPGEERAVADRVQRFLRDCGLQPDEDDAGPAGRLDDGEPLRRARADGRGRAALPLRAPRHRAAEDAIEPVVEDGVVRNARPTILGADNKAAVAAMLEAARRVLAENRPHAGIELLFTPKEEVGLLGAFAFDHTRLRAKVGYVYDQAAPIGDVDPRRAVGAEAVRHVPRPRRARRHVPRGGPLRDRRRREGDRRDAARPHRRGDDRERRR